MEFAYRTFQASSVKVLMQISFKLFSSIIRNFELSNLKSKCELVVVWLRQYSASKVSHSITNHIAGSAL